MKRAVVLLAFLAAASAGAQLSPPVPMGTGPGVHSPNSPFQPLPERADVLSVHVALGPDTKGFIGRDLLARMKPRAMFINTARGEVVDHEALTIHVADAIEVGEELADGRGDTRGCHVGTSSGRRADAGPGGFRPAPRLHGPGSAGSSLGREGRGRLT